jgi:hypothetical protein
MLTYVIPLRGGCSMKARIIRGALCTALALPIVLLAVAGPSEAKTKPPAPTIKCTVSGTGTISPGIGQTPEKQTITATTSLSDCTSSIAGITGSSAGTTTTKEPATDCSEITSTSTVKSKSTIDWNNGTTSAESIATTEPAGTETGKITSGEFKKDTVSGSVSYSPNKGFCSGTTTLNSITITGTVDIS